MAATGVPFDELKAAIRDYGQAAFQNLFKCRALGDANRQLELLQATYGTGKEIVVHALCHELDKQGELERAVGTIRTGIEADTQALEHHQADLERIGKEIGTLEETIRNLQSTVQTELENEEALKDIRWRDQSSSNTALETATARFNQFKKGEKAWRVAARNHADHDQGWLEQWLDREIETLNEATIRNKLQIERLQDEKNTLEVGSSNQKTATLAKAVGGQTLEEALDSVTEGEALALNMGLCGLADGVTGVTPDVLVHLEANKDLPDIFWLGETPPGPATVRSVGEWHVATGAGGYIVSSKARHPVFGRQARLDRIGRIDTEIDKLLKKQEEARLEKEGEDGQGGLKGRQKLLQINSEAIAFFIQNRTDALAIESEVATAKAKHEEVVRLYLESETKVTGLRKKLLQAAGSHQGAHEGLKLKQRETTNKITDLNNRLPGAQQKLLEAQKNLTELNEDLASILEHLGLQAETFLADASTLEAEMSEIYVVKQTKRLMQLGDTLKDELPDRLRLIHEASATDTASCIRLWPMLLEVLRDRVVLDLADMDGTDLLGAMRTRRNDLDQKLGLQENEVKIQARSINSAIRSAVTSQRNRIKALSRMGENIHFGNVVGIRIAVQTHQDMLGMLESFADQMTLFAEDTKPVDEALHEFFDKAGDKYKFTGEELLVFDDGATFKLGAIDARVIWTPGHTPACLTYVIGDAAFVGDTLFMPDYGTARCDFPGGDAATLYRSIQKIFALPDATRLFLCHDYKAPGRDRFAWETTVKEERERNVHVGRGVSEPDFVKMRTARDKTLSMPKLILPSVQVNMRAGEFPPPDENGVRYLKLPLNAL